MNVDPQDPAVDDTPEYPLPSPTDSLSRDQRPPDDGPDVEPVPNDDVRRTGRDIDADPAQPDIGREGSQDEAG